MSSKNVVDLRKRRPSSGPKPPPLPLPAGRQGFPRKRVREPLRARRRRKRLLIMASVVAALLLAGGCISYASHMARFTIQSFDVTGTTHVSPQDIQSFASGMIHHTAFHFFPPNNIFLYHPKQIELGIVSHFPRIKSADVSRESLLSTTVHIAVQEREPFAKWCEGSIDTAASSSAPAQNCYLIDETGFIFAPAGAENPSSSYLFSGGVASTTPGADPTGSTFAPSHLPGILALLHYLQEDDLVPQSATVQDDEDFYVYLQNSFYIKASFGASAEDLVKNLTLILDSDSLKGKQDQIEYIDLRFGSKVYFKLKGQDQTSST